MIDATIVCAIVSAISAITVAGISAWSNKQVKKEREGFKQNESNQVKERLLTMKLISANCKLSAVTAKTVLNHKTNGDVQDAFESVQEAQQEYYDFINRIAVENLSKKS